jgi:hypothetical protein
VETQRRMTSAKPKMTFQSTRPFLDFDSCDSKSITMPFRSALHSTRYNEQIGKAARIEAQTRSTRGSPAVIGRRVLTTATASSQRRFSPRCTYDDITDTAPQSQSAESWSWLVAISAQGDEMCKMCYSSSTPAKRGRRWVRPLTRLLTFRQTLAPGTKYSSKVGLVY